MAPSTRGRARKSSAEDISPPVDPITPVVEQPTPVVPVVEGSSSTLSEGINQPTDSEEVSDDVSYDEDSPSSDESDSSVRKHKKRKLSKRRSLEDRFVQLVDVVKSLAKSVKKDRSTDASSEEQSIGDHVSSRFKPIRELTDEEKRIIRSNQTLKNMKCPEFTNSSDASEINKYVDEFRDYCRDTRMTEGRYLVGEILSSLKGPSKDWFRTEVIGAEGFVEENYTLENFCESFRRKYLPSDHIITLFKQTIDFKLNQQKPRKSFDDILIYIDKLLSQVNGQQLYALFYYCVYTPTSMQDVMDEQADLKDMRKFVDSFVKHYKHHGKGKTGEDDYAFKFVNRPSGFNRRNNFRASKSFRPKGDKQEKTCRSISAKQTKQTKQSK
ncbi:hypothetical protein B5S29_g5894 [[Candida] boidinii]|nr:hypothetical protein B5S29_g5894 [[Candida] boidinii]